MLRYLPVQAAQSVIGVPLDVVVEVRTILDSELPTIATKSDALPPLSAGVPSLSLSAILGGSIQANSIRYAILVNCPHGVYGLLVEGIALPQIAVSVDSLPILLASHLFSNVVAQSDAPVLLLNIDHIGQIIYQVAAPEHNNAEN